MKSIKSIDVLFITVSYNNFNSTRDYIESFRGLKFNSKSKLLVVDNSISTDLELKSYIEQGDGDVVYIRQDENLGYISGCNYGLAYYRKYYSIEPEVVIYSNNDIVFESDDFIKVVRDKFKRNPDLGIIAPYVIDTNTGRDLNPFLVSRPTKKMMVKLKVIYSSYFVSKIFNSLPRRNKKTINNNFDEIYASHGCIFIMSALLLREKIDDGYFLYGEEITVAERCLSLRKTVVYMEDIKVKHISHATTGKVFSQKEYEFKKNSIKYINNKYTW
ncbi:hypothetical protein A1OS_21740 [Enterovibrio norvegicus]|uniref:glycosyltransferase family 2 protein n=1 Tax=Enterovibrio norvegicus TaxID=188144 RepID=UPI0002D788B8|nr:glycosyltransferase [Enterovibrio norvegicus]OEE57328.1 hypothetical protein A1OS_21740 [Enterovibrio norvegicus]